MSKTPKQVPDHHRPQMLSTRGQRRRLLCRSAGAALLGGLNLGLAGCGGGGADDAAAAASAADERRTVLGVDSGGTGAKRAMFVSAPVDMTLPLTLNGLQFDTRGSAITDADGRALSAAELLPGMTCQIEAASVGAGLALAQRVRVGEQLLGPVTAIDAASGSFVALGQRVVMTAGTVFDAALAMGPSALQAGQVVRVWGQLDIAGARIVATRLGLAAAGEAFVVRGALTRLERDSARVQIGSLVATALGGDASLIADDVAVGSVVRARLAPGVDGGGVLLALRGDALQLPDRVEAEVEGRVTNVESARHFAVDGVRVDASAASSVQGANLIALGARVAVHGRSVKGLLLASIVRVEPDEPVELEGAISAADAARRSFVLRGVTVVWSDATVFEGGGARLLAARRRVAVIGRWNAERSQLVALHIHVES